MRLPRRQSRMRESFLRAASRDIPATILTLLWLGIALAAFWLISGVDGRTMLVDFTAGCGTNLSSQPPLFRLIAALMCTWGTKSPLAVWWTLMFAGAAVVVVSWLFARSAVGDSAASVCAIVVAFAPMLIALERDVVPSVVATPLIVLSWWLASRTSQQLEHRVGYGATILSGIWAVSAV